MWRTLGSFGLFFSARSFHRPQDGPDFRRLLRDLQFCFELGHLGRQRCLHRRRGYDRSARALIFQLTQHRSQSAFLPLVVGFPRDPSIAAASVAVISPVRTFRITSARARAACFVFMLHALESAGPAAQPPATLQSRRQFLATGQELALLQQRPQARLSAAPSAKFARLSNACSIPSIARSCTAAGSHS